MRLKRHIKARDRFGPQSRLKQTHTNTHTYTHTHTRAARMSCESHTKFSCAILETNMYSYTVKLHNKLVTLIVCPSRKNLSETLSSTLAYASAPPARSSADLPGLTAYHVFPATLVNFKSCRTCMTMLILFIEALDRLCDVSFGSSTYMLW